jgi:hypothetical protein
LDLENIAELEYQVRKDKHSVASHLRGLMMHLLKYQFQPQRRTRSWISTIIEHRTNTGMLEQMPSLRPQIDEYVARIITQRQEGRNTGDAPPPPSRKKTPTPPINPSMKNFSRAKNEKAADP